MSKAVAGSAGGASAAAGRPFKGFFEALSGEGSSERVSDLANLIGEHLPRFLVPPSSSDSGGSIFRALAWLAGAWSTAIAAPVQSTRAAAAAVEEVNGAAVIAAAQSYSTKLAGASADPLTYLEKGLRAPAADALGGAAGVLFLAVDVLAARRDAERDWLGAEGKAFAMGDLLEGALSEDALKNPPNVARLAASALEKGFAPVLDALHAAFEATLLADAVRVAGLLRAKEAGVGPNFLGRLFSAGALSLAPREGGGGGEGGGGAGGGLEQRRLRVYTFSHLAAARARGAPPRRAVWVPGACSCGPLHVRGRPRAAAVAAV